MSRSEVVDLVRDRMAEILERGPEGIEESSRFDEDLDADSLALIELVEILEQELGERTVGFQIDDEDLEDLKTIGDAVDYVMAKIDRGASSQGQA
jgi:acyl carrier protein